MPVKAVSGFSTVVHAVILSSVFCTFLQCHALRKQFFDSTAWLALNSRVEGLQPCAGNAADGALAADSLWVFVPEDIYIHGQTCGQHLIVTCIAPTASNVACLQIQVTTDKSNSRVRLPIMGVCENCPSTDIKLSKAALEKLVGKVNATSAAHTPVGVKVSFSLEEPKLQ